jgi:beta-lactamase class A
MRVIARSLAVAGVVACGALAAGLSSCGSERTPTGEGEVERARTADARLTSPFLEGIGVRDGSPAIRRVRDSLAARIRSWEARDPSLTVSVYVRDLHEGSWTGIREREPFVPASLMKVPVFLHGVHRMAGEPGLAEEMRHYPGPASMPSPDNLAGAPEEMRMEPGSSYPYRELLERMIRESDNHAKDLLMAGVDPREVEALMARLDVPKRVEGREAVMDARTYGTLFRVLFNSTWFSRPESEWALDVLASARFQRGIRAGVPPGVTVASKYGVHADPRRPLDGVQLHECGIVYAPRAPYVLCAMTRSTYRAGGLHDLLAELSGVVWRVAGVAPGT